MMSCSKNIEIRTDDFIKDIRLFHDYVIIRTKKYIIINDIESVDLACMTYFSKQTY